ncbi:MAG: hypothetical protein ACOYMN_13240, partial [Roseimicrobium sp.]
HASRHYATDHTTDRRGECQRARPSEPDRASRARTRDRRPALSCADGTPGRSFRACTDRSRRTVHSSKADHTERRDCEEWQKLRPGKVWRNHKVAQLVEEQQDYPDEEKEEELLSV